MKNANNAVIVSPKLIKYPLLGPDSGFFFLPTSITFGWRFQIQIQIQECVAVNRLNRQLKNRWDAAGASRVDRRDLFLLGDFSNKRKVNLIAMSYLNIFGRTGHTHRHSPNGNSKGIGHVMRQLDGRA